MNNRIVIIGAGPAGVSVVETLRTYDQEVVIEMFSTEPYPPYSPPAMVDHFVNGSNAHIWRGTDWPERMKVDYHSGCRVVSIDTHDNKILLADGSHYRYDQLVIASGSRLHSPIKGADLQGVYNFKSLSAAEELVGRIRSGAANSAIIVGAGFIGMEIALLLRELGLSVTQVEMQNQVMPAMLDEYSASFALNEMQARGINVMLNTKAVAFNGDRSATEVVLDSGEILTADIHIAATGVAPNVELLAGSDIRSSWGICVDDHLRTSAKNIYAAGDVVEAPDRLTGETFVHAIFPNALEQGRVVGYNLAGFDISYEGAHRMNSLKHLGIPILAVGLKEGDEVLRSKWNGTSRAIYLKENRLVGFQLIGDIKAAGALRSLLVRGEKINQFKDQILEPGFGQGTLAWRAIRA
jgi:NAD(P)H-nitrite reductase large subunit